MKTKYLTSTIMACLCYCSSFANIVYTDMEDTDLANDLLLNIDFDNDGEAEFTFEGAIFDDGILETNVEFLNENYRFATISNSLWDHTTALSLNEVINEDTGWNDYGYALIYDDFTTNEDAYIAVQFPINDVQHYGWIRVLWNGSDSFIIKDFAYNDVPEEAIEAGIASDTPGLSIIEFNTAAHAVYPNPCQDRLHFNKKKTIKELQVYKSNGQVVLYKKAVPHEIDISFLPTGIYRLEYQDEKQQRHSETFIKQ